MTELKSFLPDGDAEAGKKIFEKNCTSCHSVESEDRIPLAPNLQGVVFRKAGLVKKFPYSK